MATSLSKIYNRGLKNLSGQVPFTFKQLQVRTDVDLGRSFETMTLLSLEAIARVSHDINIPQPFIFFFGTTAEDVNPDKVILFTNIWQPMCHIFVDAVRECWNGNDAGPTLPPDISDLIK